MRITLGVISDTHGLVRPDALQALKGSSRILHAGDVGSQEVLSELSSIADVTAVRGNVDAGAWSMSLPRDQLIEIGGQVIYMLHDLAELDLDPVSAGIRVVVSGHTHKPVMEERAGVLYLNPGSAGPRRFKLPISLARLEIAGDRVSGEIVILG
jgi:putative phosphoesterase